MTLCLQKRTYDKDNFAFKPSVTLVVVAMEFLSFKSIKPIEGWKEWLWKVTVTNHDSIKNALNLPALPVNKAYFPLSSFPVVWGSAYFQYRGVEVNVFVQVEMLGVHVQVFHHVAVRHKWREMFWRGKIWEARHFFARVDNGGLVHRAAASLVGKFPQPSDVRAFLKADRLKSFV